MWSSALAPVLRATTPLLVVAAVLATPRGARAQDVVEGRATLLASYGMLFTWHQDEYADPYVPRFGHGVFLRLGGERCGSVCLGLSALGTIPVDPTGTGSFSVGPHIGFDREGPSWGGPVTFRIGAVYTWLREQEATFEANGDVDYSDPAAEHGVGAWLELTLELFRRPTAASPVIGLQAGYTAVVTTDPVAHVLGVRATFGFSVARTLDFSPEDEREADPDEEEVETDPEELDEDEERRLRDAEDVLRRW